MHPTHNAARAARLLAVLLMPLGAAQQAMAVNKCTGQDGLVVYQDAPCAAAAASATVKTWHDTPRDAPARVRQQLPAPQAIKWVGSPNMDVIRAEALLDSMHTQGRDCEWALKVTKGESIAAKCVPFMGALQDAGQFQQVTQRLQDLMLDKAWAANALPTLRRCTSLMEGVVRQKELMLALLDLR